MESTSRIEILNIEHTSGVKGLSHIHSTHTYIHIHTEHNQSKAKARYGWIQDSDQSFDCQRQVADIHLRKVGTDCKITNFISTFEKVHSEKFKYPLRKSSSSVARGGQCTRSLCITVFIAVTSAESVL